MSKRSKGGYQERLFVAMISAAVGLGLAGVLANWFAVAPPAPSLSSAPLEFSGSRALAVTNEFVTAFPARQAGNTEKARAAQWLVDHLVELGYDPQVQSTGVWVHGTYYPDVSTVWVVRRGQTAGTVAVYGHYDIPAFVTEGAADDASAVGALFELASEYADETPAHTVAFVFFDGSEYGLTGSELFASRPPFPDPIVAAVGLDFLNPGDMAGISVECIGTRKGYTPVWLRSLAQAAAQEEAGSAVLPDTMSEWVERSVAVSPTDTGPLLEHGIPAVNLAGLPADTARERAIYHTAEDLVANLTVSSMEKWGRTAELIVRTVDGMESVPGGRANSMVYLGLDSGLYIPGWAIRAIQLLIFSPLFAVVAAGWYWRRRHLPAALGVLLGEARRIAVPAGCLLLGLLVLKLEAIIGLLPRYSTYPATPKDPFLYHPAILPLLIALVVAGGAGYAIWRYTRWFDPPLGADWSERHHAFTTLLAVLAFLVWLEGAGFAAVLFLALPACLWLFLGEPTGRSPGLVRVVCGLLVVAGTAAFVALLAMFGRVLVAGPGWWYLVCAATFGLFGVKTSLTLFFAAALHWEAFACATGLGAGRLLTSEPTVTARYGARVPHFPASQGS